MEVRRVWDEGEGEEGVEVWRMSVEGEECGGMEDECGV